MALLGLLVGGVLAGCASVWPSHEERVLPGETFDADAATVREAARVALKKSGFVLETEGESGFSTLTSPGAGFKWQLIVSLHSEFGATQVIPRLSIYREYALNPWRTLGLNMSGSTIEDARLEGGNYQAFSHDREMIQGDDERANLERERRIDDLSRRVNEFLSRLEKEVKGPK